MSKICMISQPRYMPSLSFIERISLADTYVSYDTVQRLPRFYENRQKLINPNNGTSWATVSICSSNREIIKYSDLCGFKDYNDHKKTLFHYYGKYPHYSKEIVDMYYSKMCLSYNMGDSFLEGMIALCEMLEIDTAIVKASELEYAKSVSTQDLVNICNHLDHDTYITGELGGNYGMSKGYCESVGLTLIEHKNTIEPQVTFFHQLFLDGLDYWKDHFKNVSI